MKWKTLPVVAALAVAMTALTNDGPAQPATSGPVRVLLIDGQNNHNWQATTPVLVGILKAAGRFEVEVATAPPSPKAPAKPKDPNDKAAKEKFDGDFAKWEKDEAIYQVKMAAFKPDLAKVDVVVSNYNGRTWSPEVNRQLDERLKEGKLGLVIVHAANNAFTGWTAYDAMIGMGWRDAKYGDRLKYDEQGKATRVPKGEDQSSGHRYTGPFSVVVRDGEHPVTKGMPREWMHNNDELYDNMRGPAANVHMLATAYSKGTMTHEPMIWTVAYGKGRVFHTPMGHDVNAMKCVGFAATLQRGTEWAATGAVTLPLPKDFPTATEASTTK